MAQLIDSIDEISADYEAILCDLWGCYHNGIEPFPAAMAALRRFRDRGGRVILLTNAPRPIPGVQVFLDRINAPEDTHDALLSSGQICADALAAGTHGKRIHYVGPDRDLAMLSAGQIDAVELDAAEALLCTGLRDDSREGPEDYASEMAEWLRRGLPLICANPDIVVDRGETRLWCAGSLARAYREIGGVVHYYGKPHSAVYAACFDMLGKLNGAPMPRERVIGVGDGIATDVAGAADAGLDALFVTGGLAAAEFGADSNRPDPALLERYLEREGQSPAFAIPFLR
ncbi:MAG: TIGR01459 family HAD-type hydrolase [Pseudomonadota bacterium]